MAADPAASLIDRAYEAVLRTVAPRRAALRAHHRRMASDRDYQDAFALAARIRGYKAATPGKNKTPWLHASDRSADGEIIPSLQNLRNRSRAVRRDDSIGTGIFKAFITAVVGTGRMPMASVVDADGKPDTVKNAALDAVWWSRCDQLSPGEGGLKHAKRQGLVYGKRLEDGDVLLRAAKRSPDDPVFIETIEGQRIRTPMGVRLPKGVRVVNGIEKDAGGHVLAYWVCKSDPGDLAQHDTVGTPPNPSLAVENFDRVAAGPGVCFVRRGVDRPGQSRGVPLLHACLQDLLDLDLLFLAALKRTQLGACLALFIKSAAAGQDLLELTAGDYGYQLDQKIEPGMIFRLMPGEEAFPLNPTMPFSDLGPLFMLAARRIGASVGLSPQTVLKFWDGTSYSGARTIQLDDRATYRAEGHDFDTEVLNWEWRQVQEDALLRGDARLVAAGVELADLEGDPVEWIGDAEAWVDPTNDATATQLKLQMRLTTYQRECARQGIAWREAIRAQLEVEEFEAEERKRRGLPARPPAPPQLKVIAGGKAPDEEPEDDQELELDDEQEAEAA